MTTKVDSLEQIVEMLERVALALESIERYGIAQSLPFGQRTGGLA